MDLIKSIIADCIVNDITVCLKNNAPTGAVLLTYCAIDAMAFLHMPASKKKNGRTDFKNWVRTYMKTDSSQPYQYHEDDLYGARCGLVHTYTADSDKSESNQCKKIAYQTNSLNHSYDPLKHPNVVVLGVDLFIRDFIDAVDNFLADIDKDDDLNSRVTSRLPSLFHIKRMNGA